MALFGGFSAGTRSIPVPSPLLGPLLESISDEAELKCTLRFLWHLAQGRGQPRKVSASTLLADEVLLAALGSAEAVDGGLRLAVQRGTLLSVPGEVPAYLLHTPENRRWVDANPGLHLHQGSAVEAVVGGGEPPVERPNIFGLYEENIGLLTPLLADELRDAEARYPETWIEAAFQEAVAYNRPSWRYISRILQRWATEGRGRGADGESGRHPEALTAREYLRKYGLPG